jgi:hypothetical protein
VFWIGVYPGLDEPMLDFIIKTTTQFVAQVTQGLKVL